jgi:transglutaminase superfamily protein
MIETVTRFGQFLQLPPADRRLLVKAALMQAAIRAGLSCLPYRKLRALVDRLAQVRSRHPVAPQASPERVAWAVARAGRAVPGATCLTQALAAKVLLERRGHRVRVRIGIGRGEGAPLLAHAWVESEGRILLGGTDLARYTPLGALEGEGR